MNGVARLIKSLRSNPRFKRMRPGRSAGRTGASFLAASSNIFATRKFTIVDAFFQVGGGGGGGSSFDNSAVRVSLSHLRLRMGRFRRGRKPICGGELESRKRTVPGSGPRRDDERLAALFCNGGLLGENGEGGGWGGGGVGGGGGCEDGHQSSRPDGARIGRSCPP